MLFAVKLFAGRRHASAKFCRDTYKAVGNSSRSNISCQPLLKMYRNATTAHKASRLSTQMSGSATTLS